MGILFGPLVKTTIHEYFAVCTPQLVDKSILLSDLSKKVNTKPDIMSNRGRGSPESLEKFLLKVLFFPRYSRQTLDNSQ